uniref:Immunoglobulin domain-containing protein n=1 Tax=Gouania willdenowi TaxID=441366 RepID=A0A8C5HL35_GOUWI
IMTSHDISLMEISNQNPTLLLDEKLIVVKVGDNLTVTCFYNNAKIYFLYKQTLDQRLHLISSAYKQGQFFSFNGDFKENPRFRQEITERDNQIKISPVQFSDTATYFCAHGELAVEHSLKMVHILGGALAFNIILILLLAFEEILHYAALNVIQVSKTGRKRNITKTECVYSTVKN